MRRAGGLGGGWLLLAGLAAGACGTQPPARPAAPPPAVGSGSAVAPAGIATPTPTPPVLDAAPVPSPDAAPAYAPRVELAFVGDIMFGGVFSGQFIQVDTDKLNPFAEMTAELASDFTLGNLETTVQARWPSDHSGHLRFVASPEQLALLPSAGLDVVSVANNHAWDFGGDAARETATYARAAGLGVVGAPSEWPDDVIKVDTFDVKGWRVGVLALTTKVNRWRKAGDPYLAIAKPDVLLAEVVPRLAAARASHDLLVVTLHWGIEYEDHPEPWRIAAAHAFVDAGADLVIGHHPHVLQGFERYKGALIAYSMGNFVFRNQQPIIRETAVLRLAYERRAGAPCLDDATLLPAIIRKRPIHQPRRAEGSELAALAARVARVSAAKPLATTVTLEGDRLRVPAGCDAAP